VDLSVVVAIQFEDVPQDGVTSQKTPFFTVTTVKTPNLTEYSLFLVREIQYLRMLKLLKENDAIPYQILIFKTRCDDLTKKNGFALHREVIYEKLGKSVRGNYPDIG
jgi:hypothetical protein